MSSEDKVLFEVQGNVGVITLNRPKQRNAQDLELLQRLDELWMQAAADEQVKVIVLNAAGATFFRWSRHFREGDGSGDQRRLG